MTKREKFQTLTGMKDILPAEQLLWQQLYKHAESIAESYRFERIDTPILEDTALFQKGTGEETDIVQKEMFSLKTKGGTSMVLRPEGTPPVIRAYLQHGMEKWIHPIKLFYIGAMFRHERPQQGRRRQLHQFGVEVLGEDDPIRDIQVIQVFFALFTALKMEAVRLEINTLGCKSCLAKYKKALQDYYTNHIRSVCADCRMRHKQNPLRLLDCKDEKCQRIKIQAPQMLDFVCDQCKDHFKQVLDYLDVLEIPYMINPHLVRGLDYYTRTVFEIFQGEVAEDATTTQPKNLALASGGRYDNLIHLLGGQDTPAVGGAMGIERVLACVEEQQKAKKQTSDASQSKVSVFIVQLGNKAKKQSLFLLRDLQKARIPTGEAFGRDSISSQLKVADKLGAKFAIILGQKEVLDNVAIIREMDTGSQEIVPMPKLITTLKNKLKSKK